MKSAPPLSLYVHVPWCVRKCPYCDFNSHQAPVGDIPEDRYVAALLGDLEHDLEFVGERELQSIFIGGGTPSLFSPAIFTRLLKAIAARLPCAHDMEVTLEANPGTIEHGRFAGYRDAGITRVSLGVQSFDAGHLKRLGRIHSPGDVFRAVGELKQAGLHNFNLDLMYALPEQTLAQAELDVVTAIDLQPSHLSHYQLTLEPGTVFHHRPPGGLPDPDAAWEMQQACQGLIAENGFTQYEVSAYASHEHRCRHNLNYWQFGDYIGIGAGAHGKLTDVAGGRVLRTTRHKQPRTYLEADTAAGRLLESRQVHDADLPFEFMLNALRLREGFDVTDFEATTGLPGKVIERPLDRAKAQGLIEANPSGRWRPSDLGWRFLNDLQALFLEASP
ncbi:MAG: radical SAM family heme chaperone HemW [Steroidobacteraceae bacterium]